VGPKSAFPKEEWRSFFNADFNRESGPRCCKARIIRVGSDVFSGIKSYS
jgi:hypothetical protein